MSTGALRLDGYVLRLRAAPAGRHVAVALYDVSVFHSTYSANICYASLIGENHRKQAPAEGHETPLAGHNMSEAAPKPGVSIDATLSEEKSTVLSPPDKKRTP